MAWGLWSVLKSLYLRRRALFAPQNSCDPIFTPLEYIKSDDSKTQYIILDYKPNHKTKIIMESKIDEDGGAGFAYGADNGWGVNDFALYYGYKSTSTLINAWGNVAASQYSFNISSTLTDKNTILHYNKDLFFNQQLFDTNTSTLTDFQCSVNLCLFANNRNGNPSECVKNFYLYSFKIYEENSLLYDLIPVLDSNNVPCLYDTISKSFYYNQGTAKNFQFKIKPLGYIIDSSTKIWLDGIYNNGLDSLHSDTLDNGWVDLTGNCDPTTLESGNTILVNGVQSNGTQNGRITVPTLNPINFTGDLTIELVFNRLEGTTNSVILGRNYQKTYYINTSSASIICWAAGSNISAANYITLNNINYLQFTLDSSSKSAKLFFNGELVSTKTLNNISADSSSLQLFGYSGNKTSFNGNIYSLRIHNRILSESELLNNFNLDFNRFGG